MKKTLIRSEMLNNKSPAPAGFYFMIKNKNNPFLSRQNIHKRRINKILKYFKYSKYEKI